MQVRGLPWLLPLILSSLFPARAELLTTHVDPGSLQDPCRAAVISLLYTPDAMSGKSC